MMRLSHGDSQPLRSLLHMMLHTRSEGDRQRGLGKLRETLERFGPETGMQSVLLSAIKSLFLLIYLYYHGPPPEPPASAGLRALIPPTANPRTHWCVDSPRARVAFSAGVSAVRFGVWANVAQLKPSIAR